MENRLYCGAAKADITPEKLEGLIGLMGIPYAGVIDRLHLRVIALQNGQQKALLIGFDLDKAPCPVEWLPELEAVTGIPQQNIIYLGVHTHSAPLTTVREKEHTQPTPEQRVAQVAYENFVHEKLFAAVSEALAALRPARMGVGVGECYINVNRNAEFVYTDEKGEKFPFISEGPNWAKPVDRTLFTVRFEAEDGTPLAFFVNYPVHCCIMFCNNFDGKNSMGISGDIAGNVSTAMEERFPGSVALWSSGAAGNVDPILFNSVSYPSARDGSCLHESCQDLESTKQMLHMLVGWHMKAILDTLETVRCQETETPIASALEWSETPGPAPDAENYRIRLHLLRIGSVALYGIGGELYNEFGSMIKAMAPLEHTAVINHEASLLGDAGYILDDDTMRKAAAPCPVRHGIPGGQHTHAYGCLEQDLKNHTVSLFAKVLNA